MSYLNDLNVERVYLFSLDSVYLSTLNHYSSTVTIHMHSKLQVIRMIHMLFGTHFLCEPINIHIRREDSQ